MRKLAALLTVSCLFVGACSSDKEKPASTSLPLVGKEWTRIDLNESYNSDTYVLELQHGWLVYRKNGFGAGMAFVPAPAQPTKQN